MTGLPCSKTGALLATVLLALAPEAARAEEKVPNLADEKANTQEVQILGWSADEKRFALRVYDLTERWFGDSAPPPACKGYVDHKGEKFVGGLSFVLYEGGKQVGGWRIQDAKKCTPPETARERLAKAKAALAEKGIDLTATGATLAADLSLRAGPQKKGKDTEYRLTSTFPLPHGPWAGTKFEADAVVVEEDVMVKDSPDAPDSEAMPTVRGRAKVQLRLVSGKRSVAVGDLKLGPDEADPGMSWVWTAGFDRALLSPSGKVLVPLVFVRHGDMRLFDTPRILMAPVDLADKLGPAPTVSAPAR
ncbi:hypothetical protein [Corallococcus carmarthensis]|uniref:hypothetical protein n=1 Tax=Corallococcus carmarthensis TaxID=2316728 RepID=UPI0011C42672|nr:hypothetical protein [Corallococcus carmarthensis]